MTEILLYPDRAADPEMPPESEFIAPGGPKGTGGPGTFMLRNVSRPSLIPVRPGDGRGNGAAVIIAPGGGWRIHAWTHEGTDLADRLVSLGYTVFLLKYRLMPTIADDAEFMRTNFAPPTDNPWATRKNADLPRSLAQLIPGEKAKAGRDRAVEDGQAALALVRARAEEFGINPQRVGMVGFSAGAFLTASVALDPGPGAAPLAFAAPIYGGETAGAAVPGDAPPLFMAVAADDKILVRVCEGLYADWIAADRDAEIHVFRDGGHGFGVSKLGLASDAWLGLFETWLAAVSR